MSELQDLLIHACKHGLAEAFDEAFAAGADVHAPAALLAAATDGQAEMVRSLLALGAKPDAVSGLGVSALAIAAANGHVAAMRVLLDAGADTEIYREFNGTALHQAIDHSRADAAMLLIERGADIEARDDQLPLLRCLHRVGGAPRARAFATHTGRGGAPLRGRRARPCNIRALPAPGTGA